jgi:hypothetical protein
VASVVGVGGLAVRLAITGGLMIAVAIALVVVGNAAGPGASCRRVRAAAATFRPRLVERCKHRNNEIRCLTSCAL